MPNQNPPLDATLTALLLHLGLSTQAIIEIARQYDEPYILRHARYTEWQCQKGRVDNPPGWLVTSLKFNFCKPRDFPAEREPVILTFKLDGDTFAVVQKIEKVEGNRD